jgi:Domain of unknown function (DUF4878)
MVKQFVLGVAMVAAVTGCSRGNDPKAVVQDFFSRMTSGNCTGIKDLMLAAQRDQFGSAIEEGCSAAAKAGSLPQQGASPNFGDVTENGDDATVRISDDSTQRTVRLKKENGAWKIDVTTVAM